MAQLDDPAYRAALQHALACVGASRTQMDVFLEFEGPPEAAHMVPWGIAEIAAIALAEVDRLGGDSAALMERIYLAVAGGRTEGAGHG
jgi:hypothetical protein